MKFPDTDTFNKANVESKNKLLDVMMLSGDNEMIDDNLKDWKLISVTSSEITVDVEYENPLLVSQGDIPDILVVQAGLQEYPDENNLKLPPSVMK